MVILGDVATSDAVEGNEDKDEDQGYNPPDEQEEDDTPRAVRGEDHRHDATVEEADEEVEEVEEEAPIARAFWSEVPSMGLERSSQQESMDRAEAIRNKEAYQAMTANAVPLIPPPSNQPSMQTPTRKRTRPFEIAASDDSSSFDPISPERYANSTPRRSAKRVRSGTPLSGSRRRSAPEGWSPSKGESLETFETLKLSQSSVDGKAMFKEEKPRPHGFSLSLTRFTQSTPESLFKPSNGQIKCLDCDGREFRMSGNNTFNGFEAHLKGKAHKANVSKRLENPACQYPYQESLLSSKTKDFGMDFNIPQQPIAVFANKTTPTSSVAALGAQFFAAIDADTHTKTMKLSFLEARQNNAEQKANERIEKLDASIEASNEKIQGLSGEVTEKVEASEDRLRSEIQEINERLDSTQSRNDEQLKELETRIAETSEDCEVRLDKLFTTMAKSDHRNIENIDDLKALLRKSDEASEKQLSNLQAKIVDLEQLNTGSQRYEIETSIRELEAFDLETRHLRALMESRLDAIDQAVRESKEHRAALEAQIKELQTSHQEARTLISELQTRIDAFEQANTCKEEEFHDLEVNIQVHTEDIQRQRDSNLSYQKTIKDQIEAHFQHTEKSANSAQKAALKREEEALEREKALEERLERMFEKKIAKMEKVHEEERERSRKKIQRLEGKLKELQGDFDFSQTGVGSIIEDLEGALGSVEGLKEKVEVLEGVARGMGVGVGVGLGLMRGSVRAVSESERRQVAV
ncbi:hypothetical protein BKA61DRAFT_654336 [Leptodontidium sp. MPI-SDFR-AT-0119]|nr:hypothetical protein BKA61DRAFT_654336 [Leptodontidium sp. MPI-SDFR-AT-0119]